VVAGTTGHYNIFAWLVILCGTLLAGHLLSDRPAGSRRVRIVMACEIGLGAVFVVLSQSRQGSLGLVVVAAFGIFYWERRSHPLRRLARAWADRWVAWPLVTRAAAGAAAIAVALALTVVIAVLAAPLASRFVTMFTPAYWRVTARDRGYAYSKVAPAVLRRSPLVGMGPGSFPTGNIQASGTPAAVRSLGLRAENASYINDAGWVNVLAQVGLLGVAALLLLAGLLLVAAARMFAEPPVVLPAVGCTAAVLAGMFGSIPMVNKPISIVFWTLVGGVMALAGRGIDLPGPAKSGAAAPAPPSLHHGSGRR
jgi:hypothetical protein